MNACVRNTTINEATDIVITFVVAPNDYTGDTTECTITLTPVNSARESFDTEIAINNGDWASLSEQHAMMGAAISAFYELGYDTKFGELVGM